MSAAPGSLAFFIGTALLFAPWWSSTLPARFASSGPMPWWARIVAGFFAIVCLGAAALGVWDLVRDFFGRRPDGGRDPPA